MLPLSANTAALSTLEFKVHLSFLTLNAISFFMFPNLTKVTEAQKKFSVLKQGKLLLQQLHRSIVSQEEVVKVGEWQERAAYPSQDKLISAWL